MKLVALQPLYALVSVIAVAVAVHRQHASSRFGVWSTLWPSLLSTLRYLAHIILLTLGTCARVTVLILCVCVCLSVCLCVCVCVCYRSSAHIRRVCDKIGLPMYSSLHAKGFKLSVFAKKPSFSSSSFFSLRAAEWAAILKHWSCNVDNWRPFPYWALRVGKDRHY